MFGKFEIPEGVEIVGADESLDGQSLTLSGTQFDAWLPEAKERLEDALAALLPENNNPAPKPKAQTRPKPKWYPMLLEEMTKAAKRITDYQAAHPGKLGSSFPQAPQFKTKLIQRGVPASMLGDRVFRYPCPRHQEAAGAVISSGNICRQSGNIRQVPP